METDRVEGSSEDRDITWEIVPPDKLRSIVADTLEQEVRQIMATLHMYTQLIGLPHPTKADRQNIRQIPFYTVKLFEDFRKLTQALRQDPNQKLPLDHKYESAGGGPIIALDLIGKNPE